VHRMPQRSPDLMFFQIKCIVNEHGLPCKRCTERGLACVLNKSLQTLIDEGGLYVQCIIPAVRRD
jgi:hypothetical protein